LTIMGLPDKIYEQLCRTAPPAGGRHTEAGNGPDADEPAPVSHINIGVGTDLTIAELAEIVSAAVGYKGRTIWDASKPDGTPRKLLDISRLSRTGWAPRIALADGIRATYRWYLEKSASGHFSAPG
ncbi:MAG: hypothetical protein WAL90_11255, partial [Desulfobacterales bacterium]